MTQLTLRHDPTTDVVHILPEGDAAVLSGLDVLLATWEDWLGLCEVQGLAGLGLAYQALEAMKDTVDEAGVALVNHP